MVNVKITPSEEGFADLYTWLKNSTGLMGAIHGHKMLARDGVTELTDPNEFGQEWQVRDSDPTLFEVRDRYPQYPEKCVLRAPSDVSSIRRRLGESISRPEAEIACAGWSFDERAGCIRDVMATGNTEYAEAGGY
ncbi:expressed unknown protein [Seminavis robusta]|uniref:Uncharacterized protein n=1 Tax=Seminavis robusta TaxID=568900 RepID=A0A9N8E764_9STRA|nr:expressed unknown protein [Seminavis robusta]|eukprot:Sro622_g176930.1 n/a (135) ;mRNA; r:17417-17930